MMERTPRAKIGIILMAYNQGQYIQEAIESLKQQTYQDFEVHLLDDGSNDGKTPQILKEIQYEKISKKYPYATNLGTAKRQLQQYEIMDNEYILIFCADDKLAPTFLEKTSAYLDKHPKCGAVSTNILEYKDTFDSEPYYTFKYKPDRMTFPYMLSECHCLGSSLMRRQALKETDLSGGFKRYHDWDRWISMLEAGWSLGLIEETLFMYRQHNDSLSHSTTAKIESEVFDKIVTKHSKLYEKYAIDVAKSFHYKYWEVMEGKNWLEQQYFNLTSEVERLNKILEDGKKPQNILKRLGNKIRRTIWFKK